MSKTYYLFRHGETFASIKHSGYGVRILSAPILPSAEPITKRMGQFLKEIPTDYNVSSPVKRCRQTCQIITLESGKQFVFDRRISEFFIETFGMFRNRLKRFVAEMEKSDNQTILICTHGAVLAGLLAYFTKGDFNASDMFKYPPTGLLIKLKDGKIEEFDFN
jgi:broad specificity phosphatase PhoE